MDLVSQRLKNSNVLNLSLIWDLWPSDIDDHFEVYLCAFEKIHEFELNA